MEAEKILNYGLIKVNTNYIPNFISKERWTNNIKLESSIHIKSSIPITLELGGAEYILESGEHYLPFTYGFHDIKIKTDITNNNDVEIYHKCLTDEQYYNAYCLMLKYPIYINTIHKNSSSPNESDSNTIYCYGMFGTVSDNDLYSVNKSFTLNSNSNCFWLKLEKLVESDKVKTYSQFIYHKDIHLVQNDTEITKLLVNYDKDYVRQSYHPCIAICYEETNYQALKNILNSKYNIKLVLPKEPDRVYENKIYEEIVNEVLDHNEKINYYQDIGVFEFISLKKIPLTLQFYNQIYKINIHNDQNLI